MERSLYSARYCFVENRRIENTIHDSEYQVHHPTVLTGTTPYTTQSIRFGTMHDSEYQVQHNTRLRVSGTAPFTTQSIRYSTIHDSEYQVQHYHIHNSEYQVQRPVLRCGEPQDREHHTRLRVSGAVAYAGIFPGGGADLSRQPPPPPPPGGGGGDMSPQPPPPPWGGGNVLQSTKNL